MKHIISGGISKRHAERVWGYLQLLFESLEDHFAITLGSGGYLVTLDTFIDHDLVIGEEEVANMRALASAYLNGMIDAECHENAKFQAYVRERNQQEYLKEKGAA